MTEQLLMAPKKDCFSTCVTQKWLNTFSSSSPEHFWHESNLRTFSLKGINENKSLELNDQLKKRSTEG